MKYQVVINYDYDDHLGCCPNHKDIKKWLTENCRFNWGIDAQENYGWWKHDHIPRYSVTVSFMDKGEAMHFKLIWSGDDRL